MTAMTVFFETPRLVARSFDPRDLAAFTAMRADPEVARYQSWARFSEADGRAFLEDMAGATPGAPAWFQFALEERATGRFAGDCGLKTMEHDQRLAQIGYTIAPEFWNRGLASEAVAGLVRFAFGSFPIHRISASVDPRNLASCRVLEKAGFVKEAHFRRSEWFKGEWADDAIYALLRRSPHLL
jgi:[ribosomal protein S5]-alanine N-acetyltransferase